MRLTHIKLAGFKSFVDPSVIHVAGQLVAVCGPNGCGKSNVIDAVRWVLGESSAKQLRGESMQDVIFNGSGGRKPVSRASVELVFDNSAGLAAGQWSQYAEISIKRLLTRQGESSYYINQMPVRRRDITDLFLGTGVGKGGYAIIEQGMISRIIEARPEELRHFLEEAAGVSKYKERRRETETRLADTRDNLDRVDDIRRELTAQIEKLDAQAAVAAQFNTLKETIVEKQNLLALQRKLDAARDVENARRDIDLAQTALDGQVAELRAIEAALENLRETHFSASDSVHSAQAELYDANAAVARLEQQLLHLRQNRDRLNQDFDAAKQELARIEQSARQADAEQSEWARQQEDASLAAEAAAMALEEETLRLPELEHAQREAEQRFDQAREELAQSRNALQLAQQQGANHVRNAEALKTRRDRLQLELSRLAPADGNDALAEQLEDAAFALESQQLALADTELALDDARQQTQDANTARDQLQREYTGVQARIHALESLPAPVDDAVLQSWLRDAGLADVAPLFESLNITAPWGKAVEAVLGLRMQARTVTAMPADVPPSAVALLWPGVAADAASTLPLPRLGEYVRAEQTAAPLQDWLGQAWCIESAADWPQWRAQLPLGGVLVTPEGHVGDRHALHYHAAQGVVANLVAQRQELEYARQQEQTLAPQWRAVQAAQLAAMQALSQIESTLKQQRQQLADAQKRHADLAQQAARQQEAQAAQQRQQMQWQEELTTLSAQLEEEIYAGQEAEQIRLQLSDALAPLQEQLESYKLARHEAESACDLQRSRLRQTERMAQEARFAVQAVQTRMQESRRRDEDLQQRREVVAERLESLMLELEGIDEGDFDVGFQYAINLRSERERLLAAARDALNGFAQQMREQEAARQRVEAGMEPAREAVNAARLKEQEARLALSRFTEELAEAGADEAALQAKIGAGLKINSLMSEIARLSQAVNALGSVNLAALEELNTAREREQYLNAQAGDLLAAVETLENAIRRIDRETRALLQDTYNTVNANLQELFPLLFGGGHAELVLTGDEILDAGMTILAQPPGKKNSTIHLLSGGEKALTALSLVFSLFRLNPAPFCLLDEVDAPLDDANTLRFCELVKKMAERTQFLYISHNRLTMEMAGQLVGVTMQEQGVSRVVAVDIETALSMRDAATA
ncbi:chromosome segregation protein SMC [Amantichitinum ursilacus]|uniref:Chromosome partition protein Smc n=1 Tax=Amantichitinum ursilacus TaxID=857265 RepID=A0A0N1JSN8_9NEIS|nr:chromosome segregation protein SMC [Amantichitinum ursilacus]KPC52686.1 Chromosome partition protein Smc [Amantichitinum ursilacus]